MKVLLIPNWSFGRDKRLLAETKDALAAFAVEIHYCESDVDHNRTVTAFSGEFEVAASALDTLCELILPSIDLNRHVGVHPRIGALDVCPFIPLEAPKTKLRAQRFKDAIESVAAHLADKFEIPVFLFEKSERGRHEADLPALRKGGFGGLLERELDPDFGPHKAHPHLGATVMGWRDFLLAINSNLNTPDPVPAQRIAERIRQLRSDGDPRMLGVRALGFALVSRELSQVSMNLTLPDLTSIDPVLEYIEIAADTMGVQTAYSELVGVIRSTDLEHTTRIHPRPEQVVSVQVNV